MYNNNTTITFNSTGYFAAGTYIVGDSEGVTGTKITATKGHFTSQTNSKMFLTQSGTSGVGTKATSAKDFHYMNGYNSTTSKSVTGCYCYNVGV